MSFASYYKPHAVCKRILLNRAPGASMLEKRIVRRTFFSIASLVGQPGSLFSTPSLRGGDNTEPAFLHLGLV